MISLVSFLNYAKEGHVGPELLVETPAAEMIVKSPSLCLRGREVVF